MSQYELNITYIPSDDNTVANALSRLPDETAAPTDLHAVWNASINATSCITTDLSVLEAIKTGYATDDFCQHLSQVDTPGAKFVNRLWYVGDRLLIQRVGDICEQLFHLAHDTLGHFGTDKSYATLHNAYYWPNMH